MRRLFLLTIILSINLNFVVSMEVINISEMSLDEKIGQLMIVQPTELNKNYLEELHAGGIFLNKQKTKEDYKRFINFFQNNSKIKLFIATDMEGYWNPFKEFYESKTFGEISSSEEAYKLGKSHGKILTELGFNLGFSPVVETKNNVWPGRSFTGSEEEISDKISSYIKGLHSENILATAKHYPGGSMVKNPHFLKYKVNITEYDLKMFDVAIENNVDFIMIGHPIVYGKLNSNGKQATISLEVIKPLKDRFEGIIITDAVTMMGLRWSYLFNFKKVYPDLILAGNDIILDTYTCSNYKVLLERRDELKKAVLEGKISEERVNDSVKKILEKKGYKVIP